MPDKGEIFLIIARHDGKNLGGLPFRGNESMRHGCINIQCVPFVETGGLILLADEIHLARNDECKSLAHHMGKANLDSRRYHAHRLIHRAR